MRVTIELEFIEKYDSGELEEVIAAYVQELVQDGSLSYTIHVEDSGELS
tara:strand:+ start:17518 stop:17664 length:147 start_codon:yes stop_codon:yes gene_type:complete